MHTIEICYVWQALELDRCALPAGSYLTSSFITFVFKNKGKPITAMRDLCVLAEEEPRMPFHIFLEFYAFLVHKLLSQVMRECCAHKRAQHSGNTCDQYVLARRVAFDREGVSPVHSSLCL